MLAVKTAIMIAVHRRAAAIVLLIQASSNSDTQNGGLL